MQLELSPDLDYYLLRYYFTLATPPSKMAEVLQRVKDRVKECLLVTARCEVMRHIEKHGFLPKKVCLQPPTEFEDKKDFLDESQIFLPKRKMSENYSLQSHSDMVPGYRERTADRKMNITDSWMLEVMSKKEFEFPELITNNDTYKTSIFFSVRSELVQSGSNINYLPQLSSLDEFCFLMSGQTLVRMACTVIEKEPMKLIDPKSSFTEMGLGSSVVEQPKRISAATSSSERKEKIVTKMITVSIYATSLKAGESEIIYTLINNLLEKNVLENFRRFIRRMSVMRADSSLARYFLSEEPKEFRFQYPEVNDKPTFLLILKNNLHLLMSRVTGTLDSIQQQSVDMSSLVNWKSIQDDTEKLKDLNLKTSEQPKEPLYDLLQPGTKYKMNSTCTDTVFFFNYNESNAHLFGPVLFFLNIAEQDFKFTYYPEFQANDGQYTCLVKPNEVGQLEFDSLVLEDLALKPRLSILNGIKHVRHAKDAPPMKGVDDLIFNVSSRGQLKPEGLIEALNKAITNSVIELAIEQWLHSLYFKAGLNWRSETKESEIVQNLRTLLLLGVQPPSVNCRSVSHKLQSLNYFKFFVGSLMKTIHDDMAACFKNKESLEDVFYYQSPEENDLEFAKLEDLEAYLAGDYTFHEWGKSSADSEDELAVGTEEHGLDTPLLPVDRGTKQTEKLRKLVTYRFDVTKTQAQKLEAFVMVMRLRSPPVSDSTPLEQYSKANAHQAEPKVAQSTSGDELKSQFPLRRFLVCLQVSKSDVSLLTYNVKDEVIGRLFETMTEEITFHEIRETLILGLSTQRVMRTVIEEGSSDFDARVVERYEQTRVDNQKKLNDREIGLKSTWDLRFSDRYKAKTDQLTITERVYELIRKPSNRQMSPEGKICIAERHRTKQLMDAVCSTIVTAKRKIKTENLDIRFLQDPTFLKDDTYAKMIKSPTISHASQGSKEYSDNEASRLTMNENHRASFYLTVPRRSIDEAASELSVSLKSKRKKHIKASSQSPSFHILPSSSKLTRLGLNIELPMTGTLNDELPSPTEGDEIKPLKKTKTEVFVRSNYSMKSSYEEIEGGVHKPISFETAIEKMAEQATVNLTALQRNFSIHLFDLKVRQLFLMPEDQRMDHFQAVKSQRSLLLLVDLVIEKHIPLFYFDDESSAEMDTEKAIAIMAMDYSEHYLNMFSKFLDLAPLEQKYKLHKVCIEESIIGSTSDFIERSEIEKDEFYTGNFS